MNRREFLKKALSAALALSFPFPASANILDVAGMIKLIKLSCIKCSFDGFCVSLTDVAPRISYWIPKGFIETGAAFEIGKSASVLSPLKTLLNPIKSLLNVPSGSKTLGELRADEVYEKLYPHYFGIPACGIRQLLTAIASARSPSCLCSIGSSFDFMNMINTDQISNALSNIYNQISTYKGNSKISSYLKFFQSNIYSLQRTYNTLVPEIPFFLSELVYPIWIIDTMSIDAYTIAPLFNSIHRLITSISAPAGMLACPYLTEKYGRYLQLPAGIDPSFICVGWWGYGYPRTGIVKHSDPVIAGLLSIARFHHLFSKTIPVLNIPFSYSNIKYQMYNPQKTDCFKPGEKLSSAYTYNPIPLPNRRNVGVVVWQKQRKCCW